MKLSNKTTLCLYLFAKMQRATVKDQHDGIWDAYGLIKLFNYYNVEIKTSHI